MLFGILFAANSESVMDLNIKKKCEEIRAKSSEESLKWLMLNYPISALNYSVAFQLIPHRSWARHDQISLAEYYFQKIPFASELPYKVFSSIMPVYRVLGVIQNCLPTHEEDLDLLVYYLMPVVKKNARSVRDEEAIKRFQTLLDLRSQK